MPLFSFSQSIEGNISFIYGVGNSKYEIKDDYDLIRPDCKYFVCNDINMTRGLSLEVSVMNGVYSEEGKSFVGIKTGLMSFKDITLENQLELDTYFDVIPFNFRIKHIENNLSLNGSVGPLLPLKSVSGIGFNYDIGIGYHMPIIGFSWDFILSYKYINVIYHVDNYKNDYGEWDNLSIINKSGFFVITTGISI